MGEVQRKRIAELETCVLTRDREIDHWQRAFNDKCEKVERLRGLLSEWVGQHASAEGLLEDTKATLEAGEGE